MISEVQTKKGSAALTSDQWHVVHARFLFPGAKRPYLRSIHSEWPDRVSCRRAGKALRLELAKQSTGGEEREHDEVLLRKPNFKTLKVGRASSDAT